MNNPKISPMPIQPIQRIGFLKQVRGLEWIAEGPPAVSIGECCDIIRNNRPIAQAEVTGFKDNVVFLMPFHTIDAHQNDEIYARGHGVTIGISDASKGRIINALGEPLDGMPLLTDSVYLTQNHCISPFDREPISTRIDTGIHTIDLCLPLGRGQRMGLFAGSGVGKSSLLCQIAKHTASDVNVIALIGERGCEVNLFLNQLDEVTKAKSIVVVSCSDEMPSARRQAAFTAMTIAEYFCQKGDDVMLFMDSLTRFTLAEQEINQTNGFSILPALVERSGNFKGKGSITALYTVLVEGDNLHNPLPDFIRSLLDGHIVLSRDLHMRAYYPPIDILQSLSRRGEELLSLDETMLMQAIRRLLSLYAQNKAAIELGVYQKGDNPLLDDALIQLSALDNVLQQPSEALLSRHDFIKQLKAILKN